MVSNELGMEATLDLLTLTSDFVTLTRFLVLGIFPFLTICFLNYKIYLIVNQRRRSGRRQKEDNLSLVLMAIVASFLLCNSPRIFLNMHEITVTQEIYECRWGELSDFKTSQLTNKTFQVHKPGRVPRVGHHCWISFSAPPCIELINKPCYLLFLQHKLQVLI